MSLSVLQVTARFAPDSGGIETHVAEVVRRLSAEPDLTVGVLATDRSRALPPVEDVDGVHVERVAAYPQERDYYVAPGLWKRVTRGPEQLVHLQGVHTAVPVLGALACLRSGKPYVVTLHTGGHSSPARHGLRGLQWRVLGPLLRRAAVVIGVSEHEADLFHRLSGVPRERLRVVRNGGALPLPPTDVPPLEGPVLLSLGRLERYKGHHRLVEALPSLLTTHPGARVVVLGRGPYEDELRALAERLGVADRVEIGFVEGGDRAQMARRISEASVVALLSDYEAHPVAVMEALTLRKPVLVTTTSGLTELVTAGLALGTSADPGPEEVAAGVRAQLDDPVLPPEGFRLPTWDECAAALAGIYREVLRA